MHCVIGIDDTDSQFGHCTTHLGFRLVEALMMKKEEEERAGCVFSTYPRLVRLNPNVPFKTRGNAAVCIEFECEDTHRAFETARSLLLENADVKNGANSGLVFLDRPVSQFFENLYSTAISGLANYKKVLAFLRQEGVRYEVLGNGMGIVGAAASIGFVKEDDHTYELIAYRFPQMCGKPRTIDAGSVRDMERKTFPHTFNSYDHETRRVLISPHGPDPVFLGIRADSPEVALRAFGLVRCGEDLAGHMMYLSNQCTDAHLSRKLPFELKAYYSGWLEGEVMSLERGDGGHLYLELGLEGAARVRCAVYEPSRDLCRMAGTLSIGDRVRVSGGVRRSTTRHGPIINVEKIEVLSAPPRLRFVNPVCEMCGVTMKSEGAAKGYQCRICGAKKGRDSRELVHHRRTLVPGIYLPSAGGQRHLTKQLIRYGSEASMVHPLIEGWLVVGENKSLGEGTLKERERVPRA